MRSPLSAWLSHLWPSQCLLCLRWPAQPLCRDCMARFACPVPRCRSCALQLPADNPQGLCGACLRQPPPLSHCVVAVDYGYPWSRLLTQWKYGAQPALTRHLAQWMQTDPQWLALRAQCALSIPIPMSVQRLRARGYHQSLLLARALDAPQVLPQGLQRLHHTPAQTGQGRAARLRNLRGAFSVPDAARTRIAGQCVLLVDDVITTGATLNAAAHALLQAGALQVAAVALARTP
ncbi:ComF family protein [Comamonas sp. GB3 AK4-5]|uniref:ComF family protein n=1 Tax=Comamonas sp. GB3 AK4-5 TaxID=3231487 RepID=UPI00351F40DE